MYLYGEPNCAKSYLLKPLKVVYHVFSNPSGQKSASFNWVGANEADVVFLNDFRFSENIMSWSEALNLLEGYVVMISMPKNQYSCDVEWHEDTPIFATADEPITRVVGGEFKQKETTMMRIRWKHYHFTHVMKEEDVIVQDPCGKCFAQLIMTPGCLRKR